LSPVGIPFVSALNIEKGKILREKLLCLTQEQFSLLRAGQFQRGDILLCIRGSLGKYAIVNDEIGAIASSLVILRPLVKQNFSIATIVAYWIESKLFTREMRKYDNGTAQPNLAAADLSKFLFPLPPLAEQQRIVEQIETLLKYVDVIDTDAEDLDKSITLAKQKILDLAIRGKLVPQDPTDEPASELLKKIKAEKEALVKAGKLKKDKHESFIFKSDDNCYHENIDGKTTDITDEIPFDLPESWVWCRLISIGQTNIGLTYKPADIIDNGTIVLRSNNIQNGNLDLADTVRVSCEISPSLQLNETDILICARNGSKALVGKCTLIPSKTETLSFGAFMAVFRSKQNPWVYNILNSGYFRDYLFYSNSTQICQLTQDMLKRFIIPLPPLAEQKRIVSQVEKLFSVLETMRG
jgi:type I restriction enzyme S subunit